MKEKIKRQIEICMKKEKAHPKHRYGHDPNWITLKQRRIKNWKEHPIRTFLLLPFRFLKDSWDSISIFLENLLILSIIMVELYIQLLLSAIITPFRLMQHVFLNFEAIYDRGICLSTAVFLIASTLSAFGVAPVMSFMPAGKMADSVMQFIYWAFTIFPKWLGTAESMAVYLPAAALLFSAIICSLGMVYLLYGALSNLILTVICIAVLIMNIRMLKEDMVLELYLEEAFSPLADFAYHIWRMISMVVFFFPRLVPYYNLYANDKFNYLAFKLYGR